MSFKSFFNKKAFRKEVNAFCSSALDGDIPAMRKFLREHGTVSINERNDSGSTALILAAWEGGKESVSFLLENGADVNLKDEDGWTALIAATWYRQTDVVRLLLEHKASLNDKNSEGWTALMLATDGGYEDIVKILLEAGADVDSRSNVNVTPLMLASVKGHKRIVELLLEKGADVTAKDDLDRTPHAWAMWTGHYEIVMLLEQQAKLQAEKKSQQQAVEAEQTWKAYPLTPQQDKDLRLIVEGGNAKKAREFFDKAFFENRPVRPAADHLKLALVREDKAMVRFLITWGANLTGKDMAQLKNERKDKYPHYVTLLRQCGLEAPVPEEKSGSKGPSAIREYKMPDDYGSLDYGDGYDNYDAYKKSLMDNYRDPKSPYYKNKGYDK